LLAAGTGALIVIAAIISWTSNLSAPVHCVTVPATNGAIARKAVEETAPDAASEACKVALS
jgi:hypothetical protein